MDAEDEADDAQPTAKTAHRNMPRTKRTLITEPPPACLNVVVVAWMIRAKTTKVAIPHRCSGEGQVIQPRHASPPRVGTVNGRDVDALVRSVGGCGSVLEFVRGATLVVVVGRSFLQDLCRASERSSRS
jgi:hypothetical protein